MTPETPPTFYEELAKALSGYQTPLALLLLGFIPAAIFIFWLEKRTRAVLRFSASALLARQGRGFRSYLTWFPGVMRVVAFVLAVLALARPQESDSKVRDASVEGIDIMIALDLSTSMEAADFRPNNRLHVAKEVLSEFISSRANDRIGLVVFSGAAYTQAPLTLDYHGWTVCKCGPWSQGPAMLQVLTLLEGFDIGAMDTLGPDFVHTLVEAQKLAYCDREAWYGEPAAGDVPIRTLLSTAYADARRKLIGPQASHDMRPGAPDGRNPNEPTHRTRDSHRPPASRDGLPTVRVADGSATASPFQYATNGEACEVRARSRARSRHRVT